MWIISIPIVILWIKNLSYQIEGDRISIRKGILTKVEQNIPYKAITDFMLHRSLYDRFLGIGSIKIQTAGQTQNTSGYEGKLAGLLEWSKLHQELQKKLETFHSEMSATTVTERKPVPVKGNEQQQILLELRKIRKILENK